MGLDLRCYAMVWIWSEVLLQIWLDQWSERLMGLDLWSDVPRLDLDPWSRYRKIDKTYSLRFYGWVQTCGLKSCRWDWT